MSITATPVRETMVLGRRAKIYTVTLDSGTTSFTIVPGIDYTMPIGSYIDYTYTAATDTYTFTNTNAGGTAYMTIIFFAEK